MRSTFLKLLPRVFAPFALAFGLIACSVITEHSAIKYGDTRLSPGETKELACNNTLFLSYQTLMFKDTMETVLFGYPLDEKKFSTYNKFYADGRMYAKSVYGVVTDTGEWTVSPEGHLCLTYDIWLDNKIFCYRIYKKNRLVGDKYLAFDDQGRLRATLLKVNDYPMPTQQELEDLKSFEFSR